MVSEDDIPSARLRAAIAALELVSISGSVQRSDVAERADCSGHTASRTLKHLETGGWLARESEQSHTYYVGESGRAYAGGLVRNAGDLAELNLPDTPDF